MRLGALTLYFHAQVCRSRHERNFPRIMPTTHSPISRIRIFPLIALLLALGAVIMACGSTTDNAGSVTTGSTSKTSSTAKHFKVGQQVKIGSTWIVTINSATTHAATEFDTPKAGDTYLVIDATFKNISSSEQNLSTLLQLSLKDSTGQSYDETITTFAKQPPDGKVAAGDLNRGQIVYEVPKSQKTYTLAFEADIVSSGQVVWNITI